MSYLSPLRLHFAGKFQTAPSTVNNDIQHYNNANFRPEYQERSSGGQLNGWWNPKGDAVWRLIGCRITAVHYADGTRSESSSEDSAVGLSVADSERQAPAKLVDLDPQQQLVSQIWGLEVRISDATGRTLLRGQFEPAAFIDIWRRVRPGSAPAGDMAAGAMYQSVLHSLEWGDVSESRFLQMLKANAIDGLLSIKFNVDGYNMVVDSPDFTYGRIVGTIGPATQSEPSHFTRGRHFMPALSPIPGFPLPANGINFCMARVDTQIGKVILDLGNALPTENATASGRELFNLGPLHLAYEKASDETERALDTVILGEIPYLEPDWYLRTAGIVSLPSDRALTKAELSLLETGRLLIVGENSPEGRSKLVTEGPGGLFVRADNFTFRLNPGDNAEVILHATRFGMPYAGANIRVFLDSSQVQGGPGEPIAGLPEDALSFPGQVTADPEGRAVVRIVASAPGNPRQFIDGQVYGIGYTLEETLQEGVVESYPFNPFNFVSLLVWDDFRTSERPTWYGDLRAIFQQYANLYPVMGRFLNLADYDSVSSERELLRFVFSLEPKHPNYMPVTRDLSREKVRAVIRWLSEVGADGKPLLGIPPVGAHVLALEAPEPVVSSAEPLVRAAFEGGKAAACLRRLQNHPH